MKLYFKIDTYKWISDKYIRLCWRGSLFVVHVYSAESIEYTWAHAERDIERKHWDRLGVALKVKGRWRGVVHMDARTLSLDIRS